MPDVDQLRERQEQRLLPVLEYWDAGGKHPGSIQVECRSSSANDEVIHSRHSTCGLDKSEFAPPIADYAGPLLVRLPPSPFRSLGGYFNYEGWPDQQRFMELDEALRLKARESLQIWSKPIPAPRRSDLPSADPLRSRWNLRPVSSLHTPHRDAQRCDAEESWKAEAPKREHHVMFLENLFDELRRKVPVGK